MSRGVRCVCVCVCVCVCGVRVLVCVCVCVCVLECKTLRKNLDDSNLEICFEFHWNILLKSVKCVQIFYYSVNVIGVIDE